MGRQPNPSAGASRNDTQSSPLYQHIKGPLENRAPGAWRAAFAIGQMQDWGVEVTPDIAQACLAHHAKVEAEHSAWIERVNPETHEPLVYYMRTGNRVKIGTSTNLRKRIETLSPEQVLAIEPGDARVERERHRQFAKLRTAGEWFRYEEPLVAHIDAVRQKMEAREAATSGKPIDDMPAFLTVRQITRFYGVTPGHVYVLANRNKWRRKGSRRGMTYYADDVEAAFGQQAA